MIAVCPNKECNQRYRIQPEMIGRIAKCKKCSNRFEIEELILSPQPLKPKPVEKEYFKQTSKYNRDKKPDPETTSPSPKAKSPPAPLNQSSGKRSYKAPYLLAVAFFCIAALLFMGNFHIIRGSQEGLSVVRRDSFGFREFFINADNISSISPVSAATRFPLGFKVLQREGIIKSEEVSKKRISDEEKKEIEKALQEAQREIDKIKQEAQKAKK
jgi:hypothetical protein